MNLAVFSTKSYDKLYLDTILHDQFPSLCTITYHTFALTSDTVALAQGVDAICAFVNDTLDAPVLRTLHSLGVRAILLRCAGFNNIDLPLAEELGFFVANVPSYSPEAVAEFTVALGNFNLEGFLGSTLHGKTVGIVGVGRIGLALAKIFHGFGCRLLASDPFGGDEFRTYGELVDLHALLAESDIVSLHCPLTEGTRHLIDKENLDRMKPGALLVNTSRGGLLNTKSVIEALKTGKLGGLALDVYEQEGALFYNDHSHEIIHDDTLMRLMTFPNVLVCGHQAFFTKEALTEIASTTLANLQDWVMKRPCKNSLVREGHLLVSRDKEPVRL
ncbi:D-lactate dehydrogenase [Aspergillus rambellii]|uniref:D-lactate dehydrogenase n=1 Tax=Aspergillus rambellii TaxID=308745 RepID=A0A0F8UMC7_9EURO|nr:D-lactate dehydrogenase [Aspergillus rambellii]